MSQKLEITYAVECLPEEERIEGNCSAVDPETDQQMQSLDEKWQVGYESCPVYQFNNDVEEVLSGEDGKHGQEFEQVTVRLKTGETVTVYPSPRMG